MQRLDDSTQALHFFYNPLPYPFCLIPYPFCLLPFSFLFPQNIHTFIEPAGIHF